MSLRGRPHSLVVLFSATSASISAILDSTDTIAVCRRAAASIRAAFLASNRAFAAALRCAYAPSLPFGVPAALMLCRIDAPRLLLRSAAADSSTRFASASARAASPPRATLAAFSSAKLAALADAAALEEAVIIPISLLPPPSPPPRPSVARGGAAGASAPGTAAAFSSATLRRASATASNTEIEWASTASTSCQCDGKVPVDRVKERVDVA